MLALLRISNLAIVEKVEIEFEPGLNVLTGETGSGKSIILKAISLLTGIRSSSDLIRHGESSCSVEGLFEIKEKDISALQELLPDFNDAELVIRREIDAKGKSRVYINDKLSTASKLSELSEVLIGFTGQHAQQALLRENSHRETLDSFGTPATALEKVAEKFKTLRTLKEHFSALTNDAEARQRKIRELTEIVEELSVAKLTLGEKSNIKNELARLENSESLLEDTRHIQNVLGENSDCVEAQLRQVNRLIEACVSIDPALTESKDLLSSSLVEVQEAQMLIGEYTSSLELNPEELEEKRSRLAEIARLERKYNREEKELTDYCEAQTKELELLNNAIDNPQKLEDDIAKAEATLKKAESSLRTTRTKNAARLEKAIEVELAQLGMAKAKFKVSMSIGESSLHGADVISFSLAANPGEPFRPLAKTASGGELSRLLLALKVTLSGNREPRTQIFDEIDTGIGGATAQIVGEKLQKISKETQVILITHAPQIAAFADRQFFVEKSTEKGRTVSEIAALENSARVEKIAAMLAGKDVSSQFESSAKKLLEQAK